MLISHRKKFIYTKTVKTAGTSVESYFEQYAMPEGAWQQEHHRDEYVNDTGIIGYRGAGTQGKTWFNHMPAAAIKNLVDDSVWNNYYKFCVVRNPFDKLVSMFFFQLSKGKIDCDPTQDTIVCFRNWLRPEIPVPDRTIYTIDGQFCLDGYIRYECLMEDITYTCGVLGIPYQPENLPKLKSGIRDQSIPLNLFYDAELTRRVENAYAPEFEYFSYNTPGNYKNTSSGNRA